MARPRINHQQAVDALVDDILNQVIPPGSIDPDTVYGGQPPPPGYTATRHAKAYQLKILGLNDNEIAKSVGVTHALLRTWRTQWPKFDCDMRRASAMSVAFAATVLRQLMTGDGPAALNAVKFFLRTHSNEFSDDVDLVYEDMTDDHSERIRVAIYGLTPCETAGHE